MRVVVAGIMTAVVYPIVCILALFTVIGTEGMALHSNPFVTYGISWALLYFVAGVLILGVAGFRDAALGVGVLAFSLGGLTGGTVIALMLATGVLGGPVSATFAFTIPFTLPWLLAIGLYRLFGVRRFDGSPETSPEDHA